MGIASTFVDEFSDPLEDFVTASVGNVAEVVAPPLMAGVSLYIVMMGILVMLGYIQSPIKDFALSIIKLSCVIALVTKVDTYNEYVTTLFSNYLPNGIGSALVSFPNANFDTEDITNGAIFDTLIDQLIGFVVTLYEFWTVDDWMPLLAALGVLIGLIPIALLLGMVMLAKVGLALLVAIGPVFIALFLFKPTRYYTASWISALVNLVVLHVFAIAFACLLFSILPTIFVGFSESKDGAKLVEAFRLIPIFILSTLLIARLPSISASASSRGVQIGGDLVAVVSNSGKKAGGNLGHAGLQAYRNYRSGGSASQGQR